MSAADDYLAAHERFHADCEGMIARYSRLIAKLEARGRDMGEERSLLTLTRRAIEDSVTSTHQIVTAVKRILPRLDALERDL